MIAKEAPGLYLSDEQPSVLDLSLGEDKGAKPITVAMRILDSGRFWHFTGTKPNLLELTSFLKIVTGINVQLSLLKQTVEMFYVSSISLLLPPHLPHDKYRLPALGFFQRYY